MQKISACGSGPPWSTWTQVGYIMYTVSVHTYPSVVFFLQNSCVCPLADAGCWAGWSCGLTWSGWSVFLCELTSLHPPCGLHTSGIITALLAYKCIKITVPVVCGWSLRNRKYFPGNLSTSSWHICWWSVSWWSVGHGDGLRGCDLPVPSTPPGVKWDQALQASE